jgi:ABC-2 type transport system ATP-binding protein
LSPTGPSRIEVRGLSKRFGARMAVELLDFEVAQGEVFGLLGPNGAGKTTTVRMLSGLLRPSAGSAKVCGVPIDGDGEALRQKVGLLTEQPGLYDRLTARENLRFFLKLHARDTAAAWAAAAEWMRRFGLAGREEEPCGALSKGMRQKLALVRALVHAPEVLFLDEPTSGLDPESARAVRDAVAELASEGRTIVLCSHNMTEVERLCSRVAVVKGRLLAVGTVPELRRQTGSVELHLEGLAAVAGEVLSGRLPGCQWTAEGHALQVTLAAGIEIPEVVAALVHGGVRVHAVIPARQALEDVYLELTREEAP